MAILGTVASMGCQEPDTLSVGRWTAAPGGCTYLTCTNSPEVLHHGIVDASLRGDPNAQGISILAEQGHAQIYKNGLGYDLAVESSRIRGTRPGSPELAGAALVGARLVLVQAGEIIDTISIDGVREIPYAFGPFDTLEVYRMTWLSGGASPSRAPVCNELQWPANRDYEEGELLGMERDEVLVFAGDRIDPEALTMSEVVDPSWFNFGCAGRTLAKLHLTRNTAASSVEPDSHLAWQHRQALLKLLAADYCGTGRAFTISGEELVWKGGLVDYLFEPAGLEARWDEHGAICLETPRMLDHPQVTELFGDLRQAIADECPQLPPCANTDPGDFDGARFVSASF